MSNLKVVNEGENEIQDLWVGASSGQIHLALYKNDLTPVDTNVFADMTQADFSGYSSTVISLGASATVSGKGTVTDTLARDFTHNGGGTSNTVHGYYVYFAGAGGNILLWVERFDNPVLMGTSGDKITITAKLTANSEF